MQNPENDPVEDVVVTIHLSSSYAGRVGPALDQLRELLIELKPDVSARIATPGWTRAVYGYERVLSDWKEPHG